MARIAESFRASLGCLDPGLDVSVRPPFPTLAPSAHYSAASAGSIRKLPEVSRAGAVGNLRFDCQFDQ